MKLYVLIALLISFSSQLRGESAAMDNLKYSFGQLNSQNFTQIAQFKYEPFDPNYPLSSINRILGGSVSGEGIDYYGGYFFTIFSNHVGGHYWRSLVRRERGNYLWTELGRLAQGNCFLLPIAIKVHLDGTADIHKLVNNTCAYDNLTGRTLFTPYLSKFTRASGFSPMAQTRSAFYSFPGDSIFHGATYGSDRNFVVEDPKYTGTPQYLMGIRDHYETGNNTTSFSNNVQVYQDQTNLMLALHNNWNTTPPAPYFTKSLGAKADTTHLIANTGCPNQIYRRHLSDTQQLRCGEDSISVIATLKKSGLLSVTAVEWKTDAMPVQLREVNILPANAQSVEIKDLRVTAFGNIAVLIKATYAGDIVRYFLQNY